MGMLDGIDKVVKAIPKSALKGKCEYFCDGHCNYYEKRCAFVCLQIDGRGIIVDRHACGKELRGNEEL
jgi:hypothetical protein